MALLAYTFAKLHLLANLPPSETGHAPGLLDHTYVYSSRHQTTLLPWSQLPFSRTGSPEYTINVLTGSTSSKITALYLPQTDPIKSQEP